MTGNNDWHPEGAEIPSDETIEHERLIQEVRLAQSRQKSLDEQGDDNSVFAGLDALKVELELDEFYKEHPEFDPMNMRWSKEFCEIGSDPNIKPRYDWLKKSTWTTLEAINLTGGYRPERPESLLNGSQKMTLEFLAVDMFVKIHPVNPNEPSENFRFKPQEFVTWLCETLPGSVPDPIRSLSTIRGDSSAGESCGGTPVNNHRQWRDVQRDQHRKAVRFAMKRWPDECVGKRGKKTGDAIAGVVEDHWVEITRDIKFTCKKLAFRTVAGLAREILRDEITD
jgi:hypothetical protein